MAVAAAPARVRPRAPVSVAAAWGLAATSLAAGAAAVAFSAAWPLDRPPMTYSLLMAALYPPVGLAIVTRQRRNSVGWLLLVIGLVEACASLAVAWATVALDVDPGVLPGGQLAAWLGDWLWIPAHGLLVTFLPLVFPDGRLPGRRWRPLAVFCGLALSVQVAAPMTVLPQLRLRTSYAEVYPDERLATALGGTGYVLVLVAALLCVVALLWRLARLPGGERGPYLWFAGGAVMAVMLLLPLELITDQLLQEISRLAAVISLPAGALVAIVRHRAYGIDVVVNRSLVYLALSAVLVGVFLTTVTLVDVVVGDAGRLSTLGGAAATALVLAPARERLQRVVNRAMYGQRDDVGTLVAEIGARLETIARGAGALEPVTAQIASALRLPYVGLEVEWRGDHRIVAATGRPGPTSDRVRLLAEGEVIGHLVASPRRGQTQLSQRDRAALQDVAGVAASAVHQLQLTEDLRRARQRLAAALEEERRRIRGDLHDGLGPSLATVVMGLEEARIVHRDHPERADALLIDLKGQTQQAIADIRTLVYGLRPPALDDLGLVGAIQQLIGATASRTGLTLDLRCPTQPPELTAAAEAAVYRIVQEAVTNALRHAAATNVTITISCDRTDLRVRVDDDGRGLPEHLTPGVGLTSIQDRVTDIGGTLTITSAGGTRVEALLPLETSCTD